MSRMSRTESRGVWDTLLIVAVAALAVTFAHAKPAVADDDQQEGRIVDLSADGGGANHDASAEAESAPAGPTYWLGLQGSPIDSAVLRTHLQLADDVGVVVEDVVPDSPAAKVELRKHDILLEVNGEQISDWNVLKNAVAASAGKPLDLKLIRLAKEMTISVTPEEAPAEVVAAQQRAQLHGDMPMDQLQGLLRQLPQGNLPGGMRVFGQGMIGGGPRLDMGQIPGGVSVSITRDGDGPAKITVQKGEETWTIEGDDKEAIAKLPDDVRPFVEQMLNGQAGGAVHFGDLQGLLPDQLGNFDFNFDVNGLEGAARARAGAAVERAESASKRLMERMEQLEQQLDQLREQLHEEMPAEGANPPTDPTKT